MQDRSGLFILSTYAFHFVLNTDLKTDEKRWLHFFYNKKSCQTLGKKMVPYKDHWTLTNGRVNEPA